jgi:hypothetical protein
MKSDIQKPKGYVIGPDGKVLTIDNLPLPGPGRWVSRKKAEVIAAVRGGLLSLGEAYERYELTPEEFLGWQDGLNQFGMRGLHATNRRDTRNSRVTRRMPSPRRRSHHLHLRQQHQRYKSDTTKTGTDYPTIR